MASLASVIKVMSVFVTAWCPLVLAFPWGNRKITVLLDCQIGMYLSKMRM